MRWNLLTTLVLRDFALKEFIAYKNRSSVYSLCRQSHSEVCH